LAIPALAWRLHGNNHVIFLMGKKSFDMSKLNKIRKQRALEYGLRTSIALKMPPFSLKESSTANIGTMFARWNCVKNFGLAR